MLWYKYLIGGIMKRSIVDTSSFSSISRIRNSLVNLQSRWFLMTIMVCVLVTGFMAIKVHNPRELYPDSTWYINYAVNLVNNGTYSSIKNPEEGNFFREPGYPVFLAALMAVYHLGHDVPYLDNYNIEDRQISENRGDIQFVRYAQLILMMLTILIFYNYLLLISSKLIARAATLLCSVYYPLIVYCFSVLREPLLLFLFTLSVYAFARYNESRRFMYLILAAIMMAISTLTFQVMVVYLPIIAFLILINPKGGKLVLRLRSVAIYSLVFIVVLFPWLNKVYTYYPDIRIVKTVGCALTHESSAYIASIRRAAARNELNTEELHRLEKDNWYNLSSREIFDRSFNGWYKEEAKQWDQRRNSPQASYPIKAKRYLNRFVTTWFNLSWGPLVY
jgi:hypothetical protein